MDESQTYGGNGFMPWAYREEWEKQKAELQKQADQAGKVVLSLVVIGIGAFALANLYAVAKKGKKR